ncbi:MAG: hypothetical protein GAK37_03425 [Pseudomonas sp.]|nr:MAG: hypothetical protein GAK37_03425 [Pseudomonas sp.]
MVFSVKFSTIFTVKTIFNSMLKLGNTMNELESRAIAALRKLLGPLPGVDINRVETSASASFTLYLHTGGAPHTLLCEMKTSGQPRFVRTGILELRNRRLETGTDATPVLIAPYLSPAARELCRENRVGFIDLEGNAWITFKSVSIDHRVPDKPIASRKGLKSLFRPKSLQMIQVMLRDPSRQWRVAQLAQAAGISLGHAINVRTGLLNQEWAQTGSEGFYLCDPQALLDAWAHTYEPPLASKSVSTPPCMAMRWCVLPALCSVSKTTGAHCSVHIQQHNGSPLTPA